LKAVCLRFGTAARGLNDAFFSAERFLAARVHAQLAPITTEPLGKHGIEVEA
jgi:hypothetical protein